MANFKAIEKKWRTMWERAALFKAVDKSKKKKFYVLEMFPYPSGEGLHMGHAFNYIIGDIYARFKRMKGYNVLYPTGYDSLGLPAENAAIKEKIHPKIYTERAIKNFIKQQKSLGLSYDWSRMIKTSDPEYYKWDQWIFLKMFERDLAYRKKAAVNWCSKCNTALANEQVHDGKCWRHTDTDVEIKHLEQWFFKITEYADELYEDINKLVGWTDEIKAMQRNWIGKSRGVEINFRVHGENWPVFTTRPDTIFGVTFMVISAQHPGLMKLVTKGQKKEVGNFLEKIKSTSKKDIAELEKEGAFTGSYAGNPVTGEKIPIYIGNFVVADYGCGMVMAVPSHDQRDFEFAKKYDIPIKIVIHPKDRKLSEKTLSCAFTGEGILVNSGQFSGLSSLEAIKKISDYLEKSKLGKRRIQYRLKDWLVSRQRYWGAPIPIVYCSKCGIVPVPEKDLPVKLPDKVKFGYGNPLATNKKFAETKCPGCKGWAKRETDTMDTFVNSSWYFLRYCDPKNKRKIFDRKKVKYWMPIDQYIGGDEHACMHLIYFRFYTKFLRGLGLLDFNEPALNLFNQGMLHGSDGFVMSKSRGNVVLPEEVSKKYGIDTARFFLMSIARPDKDLMWSSEGIGGSFRFINRVFNYFKNARTGKSSPKVESKLNKAIKEISEDIDKFRYNLAIIKLRNLFDAFEQEKEISKTALGCFLKLWHPFCPHITEELWRQLGNKRFISIEKWPVADESKVDLKLETQEKAVEKLVEDVNNIIKLIEGKGKKAVRAFIYVLPNELKNYSSSSELIKRRTNLEVKVFAVNDKNKYDPEGKTSKAKPGKPGIYVE